MLNEQPDPSYYKWGLFYFNRNDKRIFPPKRNPSMGWTINFANPYSVIALLVLLGAVFALTRWLSKY
ncbi:MAG: DUF5808 domain-containing protein [Bacteroidota bacterium]